MLIIEFVCQSLKRGSVVINRQDHFSAENNVKGGLPGNNWK